MAIPRVMQGKQQIAPVPQEELPKAMRELTPEQRRFVEAYASYGGDDKRMADAAKEAGIPEPQCKQWAACQLRSPRVLAAVRDLADRNIRNGALMAANVLLDIAGDRFHKDRMKAAVEILNRAGLIVETQHKVTIEDNRSEAEIKQRITELAEKLGVDPKKLLGKNVVDAEFVVVEDADKQAVDEFDAIMQASKP